jgi:hypothetical protein
MRSGCVHLWRVGGFKLYGMKKTARETRVLQDRKPGLGKSLSSVAARSLIEALLLGQLLLVIWEVLRDRHSSHACENSRHSKSSRAQHAGSRS